MREPWCGVQQAKVGGLVEGGAAPRDPEQQTAGQSIPGSGEACLKEAGVHPNPMCGVTAIELVRTARVRDALARAVVVLVQL